MSGACASLDPSLLTRLSDYVECQAEAASHAGFDAQGGALAASVLSGCLLLYVALIGYRMMLGKTYDARAALLAGARAGLVIALTSSFASYQPLVQALVLRGPAEIAGALLRPSGMEPLTPAQAVKALRETPVVAVATPGVAPTGDAPHSASVGEVRPSTTTAWLALRLAAGILLGVGPILLPLALFDTTLGLIEGWIRGLVGTLLGSAAVLIITSLECDFFEGELARGSADFATTAPIFGPTAWISSAAMVGVACCFRLTGFRLPNLTQTRDRQTPTPLEARGAPRAPAIVLSEPARARQVARAALVQAGHDRSSNTGTSGAAPVVVPIYSAAPERVAPADTLGTRRSSAPRSRPAPPRPGKRS